MATIAVGTNSYVTEAELTTYATDRGVTLTGATDVLLVKAMDWLELRSFKGEKAVEGQALEWPRSGVFINGTELDDTVVPLRIEQAQMAAAIIIDSGADLQPSVGPRVLSQSVHGAVSRTFSDKGNQTLVHTKLNSLIREFVTSDAGSTAFNVVRA